MSSPALRALERERMKRSAHWFLFESGYAVTKDEHRTEDAVRPFPDLLYLRATLDLLLVSGGFLAPTKATYALEAGVSLAYLIHLAETRILFIEKSRQMMVSWLLSGYCWWRGKAREHQLILIQSKKEEDAANLVFNKEITKARISFMESRLPKHLRSIAFPAGASYANLYDSVTGSHWWGVPEGGDIVRSNVPSVLVDDEAAFQPEFGSAFAAAKPAVTGGGQLIAVSSAFPSAFAKLIEAHLADRDPAQGHTPTLPGFSTRIAGDSLPVLTLHYSADPSKRPGTPDGDRWLRQATAGLVGGTRSAQWRREMEIEYDATGGTLAFPEWDRWLTEGVIIVPPFPPTGYKLYGTYDHGYRNASCFLVHGISSRGEMVTLWETYGERIPVSAMATIIKGEAVTLSDGRRFPGNPYAGSLVWIKADPQCWAQDQQMSDGPNKAVSDLFARARVYLQPGRKGGDMMVVNWLAGDLWANPQAPRYRITTACPKLIWELGRIRHKDISDTVAINSDAPEGLVAKDDHAFDAMKYFLQEFPPNAMEPKPEREGGTFAWFRAQAIRTKTGAEPRTFRVGQRQMVG